LGRNEINIMVTTTKLQKIKALTHAIKEVKYTIKTLQSSVIEMENKLRKIKEN